MPMKTARAIITKWYCFCNIFPGPATYITQPDLQDSKNLKGKTQTSVVIVPYDILQQMKKNKVVNERLRKAAYTVWLWSGF